MSEESPHTVSTCHDTTHTHTHTLNTQHSNKTHTHLILLVLVVCVVCEREVVLVASGNCSQGLSINCPVPENGLRSCSDDLGES